MWFSKHSTLYWVKYVQWCHVPSATEWTRPNTTGSAAVALHSLCKHVQVYCLLPMIPKCSPFFSRIQYQFSIRGSGGDQGIEPIFPQCVIQEWLRSATCVDWSLSIIHCIALWKCTATWQVSLILAPNCLCLVCDAGTLSMIHDFGILPLH